MASPTTATHPSRAATTSTLGSEAVPETDPNSTPGLLEDRLSAWKCVVAYLEEYVTAFEKIHKAQAKEYERALKVISQPLRHGDNFDQSLGGIAGFLENMRTNTQALISTNADTEKSIKGSVLPTLERLAKEIRTKSKELAHGTNKNAKEVEKARNATQKHIELLGQHTASFESTGGKIASSDDPYVVRRGVLHRLHAQVSHENNQHNDLVALQSGFESFEAHVLSVIQQTMEAFTQLAGGQGERVRILHADMLSAVQRIPPDFEWKGFVRRNREKLVDTAEPARALDAIRFPNQDNRSTVPLIEGALERKSRNKLSWGYQNAYYVVTPARFLHEFRDNSDEQDDPKPELSIYLPDASIGTPVMDKFSVKGKDRSHHVGGKLVGTSELIFKAHTAADAERWFEVLRGVAGSVAGSEPVSPVSPVATSSPVEAGENSSLGSPVAPVTPAANATDKNVAAAAAAADTTQMPIRGGDGHESGVEDARTRPAEGDDSLRDTRVPADVPTEA